MAALKRLPMIIITAFLPSKAEPSAKFEPRKKTRLS
jgi:hypothetical protein